MDIGSGLAIGLPLCTALITFGVVSIKRNGNGKPPPDIVHHSDIDNFIDERLCKSRQNTILQSIQTTREELSGKIDSLRQDIKDSHS